MELHAKTVSDLVDLILEQAELGMFMYQTPDGAVGLHSKQGTLVSQNLTLLRDSERGLVELIAQRRVPEFLPANILRLVQPSEVEEIPMNPMDELKRRWRPWVFATKNESQSRVEWSGELTTALGIVRYMHLYLERLLKDSGAPNAGAARSSAC